MSNLTLLLALSLTTPAFTQSLTGSFEVASIKPANPDARGKRFGITGRQFFTLNTSLTDLLCFAYDLDAHQIAGAPFWTTTEKYDVVAKPEGDGQPNDKQWRAMVQNLLADRFKLTFHRAKKELAVYTITVAGTGPKLTPSAVDLNGRPSLTFEKNGSLTARNATIEEFARAMQSSALERPVVDRTGIAGRFDFTLTWTPDDDLPKPPENAEAAPNLFTAMQRQLGLRLASAKAPFDVIVVESVERPSAN